MLGETAMVVGAGGITGLAGTALTNFLEMKKQEKSDKHELEMNKIELDIIRAESKSSSKGNAVITEESLSTLPLTSSISSFIPSENKVINFLRATVRPIVTYVLLAYCLFIIYRISGMIDASNNKIILEIFQDCMNVLLYISSSTILWWFGSRMKTKR